MSNVPLWAKRTNRGKPLIPHNNIFLPGLCLDLLSEMCRSKRKLVYVPYATCLFQQDSKIKDLP